jgi:hypothetical protein
MKTEIKEQSENLLFDSISALLGDKAALARAAKTLLSMRDYLYLQKFERLLQGMDIYLGDKIKFSERISRDGKKEENAKRIIHLIDSIDVDKKVDYIVNISRALDAEIIELDEYFRLIQAIRDTLMEDLIYLKDNIRKKEIKYNVNIYSLSQKGLAYQNYIGEEGIYEISSLSISVVCYGMEYDKMHDNKDLRSKLLMTTDESIKASYMTTEEFDEMWCNIIEKDNGDVE